MPRRDPRANCAPASLTGAIHDLSRHAPLLRALADEARLSILARLAASTDAVCVCDLVTELDLSQPTVSHHLKTLRDVGAVTSERRGTWIHYRLSPTVLGALGQIIATLGTAPTRATVARAESA